MNTSIDVTEHPDIENVMSNQAAPEEIRTDVTDTQSDNVEHLGDDDINNLLHHLNITQTQDTDAAESPVRDEENTQNTEDSSTERTDADNPEHSLIIPNNPESFKIDPATSRFSGTIWFAAMKKMRVTLAGLGGIGSYVGYNLGRLGLNTLFMFDNDIVERANMSGQFYDANDIGFKKADALAAKLGLYTTTESLYAIDKKFTSNDPPSDIMICGFDNMEARKMFFNSWYNGVKRKTNDEEKSKCLFIDGRLDIDTLQVFCITGNDCYNIDRYEKEFLFSDEESESVVCSLKQTSYMACMIGSVITNLFVNFVGNSMSPIYRLPFFTYYNSQIMQWKTED